MKLAIAIAILVGCGKSETTSAPPSRAGSAVAPAAKQKCTLKGSCKPCTSSADCGTETCIKYQTGAKHFSGCVDDRGCSVGDVMMQGADLCGTKNPVD